MSKPGNVDIENRAVSSIICYLSKCRYITPYVALNDKEPVWDGKLYLYKKAPKNNQNLIGNIPCQVKGRYVKNLTNKQTIKYSISTENLRLYLADGGVAFFVILMNDNIQKIFYNLLAPIDIKRYLNQAKSQKTISIEFIYIGDEPTLIIENEFRLFHSTMKAQTSWGSNDIISIEDFLKRNMPFSFTTTVEQNIPPLVALTSKPIYLYGNIPTPFPNIKCRVPIGDQKYLFSISRKENLVLKVRGKTLYKDCIIKYEKGNTILSYSNGFLEFILPKELYNSSMDTNTIKACINFKPQTLDELIENYEILMKVNEQDISVGDLFTLNMSYNQHITKFSKNLKYYRDIKQMLNYFGVQSDLNIEELSSKDENTLDSLLELHLNPKQKPQTDIGDSLYWASISNLSFLLVPEYNEDRSRYKFRSFKKAPIKCQVPCGDKKIDCSRYIYLTPDMWEKLSNIPFDSIKKDLLKYSSENTQFQEEQKGYIINTLNKSVKNSTNTNRIKVLKNLISEIESINISKMEA